MFPTSHPDCSQNHTWSFVQLPHSGWAFFSHGRRVTIALEIWEASVYFPKGTTEELESVELEDQAIRKTFGRKTRAIMKLI